MATSSNDIVVQIDASPWRSDLKDAPEICRAACTITLDACGVNALAPEAFVSILLADDATVQELNQQYRDQDKPTNVLSFPSVLLNPDDLSELKQDADTEIPVVLGDIVLGYETIRKEADEQQLTLAKHTTHMVVHSTLHLLGYDHMEDKEAEKMEAKEIAILKSMGISNPYKEWV